ncbi:MAG: hypothetical protein J1F43_01720 [Muribaculaceae bacterium]|nr:hypothetical protein [Muribaculaceae bacterium]
MNQIELTLQLEAQGVDPHDAEILKKALEERNEAGEFIRQEKYLEAMERTVSALKTMRECSDYQNPEFRMLFVALLFDLAEIHYSLKNYKQSEKEVDLLFKVLDPLVKSDEERFARYHILAMELSTRILRSRKKALDLLVKQQITTGALYEKVNSGIAAATDKLVDSLSTTAQLLASTGDIRGSLKFFAEAIKYSKKRAGKVTRKEVKMTVEMAEVMMRLRSMQPRAKRLLNAILPHAVALELVALEQDIRSLIEVIDANEEPESKWRLFLHKVVAGAKKTFRNHDTSNPETKSK